MQQGDFGLEDGQFWIATQPDGGLMDRLLDDEALGLHLDGPKQVVLAEHETLPLLGVRICEPADNLKREAKPWALIASIRLENNEVFVANAFHVEQQPSPPAEEDLQDLPDCVLGDALVLELTRRYGIILQPGTYLTRMILGEQISNEVRTRVVRHEVRDPEVAAFLQGYKRPAYPRRILPQHVATRALPSYEHEAQTPMPPESLGVVLSLPRVHVHRKTDPCIARGAFRLPLKAREIVRPQPLDTHGKPVADSGWVNIGDEEATAVVPITLVFQGDRLREPVVLRLQVPTYDEAEENTPVTGHFNIDLMALTDALRFPQTYTAWALHGERLEGPFKMAIVSEDMLPNPGE